MKFVEIYKIDNEGAQSLVAVCTLSSDGVQIKGEQKLIDSLNEGINNYSETGHKKVYPSDGLLFLEQLKFNFRSGYLNATEIKQV